MSACSSIQAFFKDFQGHILEHSRTMVKPGKLTEKREYFSSTCAQNSSYSSGKAKNSRANYVYKILMEKI
jgi:hypothetical protein